MCVSVWRASVPPPVCVNVKYTEDGGGQSEILMICLENNLF